MTILGTRDAAHMAFRHSPDGTIGAAPLRPLVVDLDGTLIRSDLLFESFFSLLSADLRKALSSLVTLTQGRANFKSRLADNAVIGIDTLPFNEDVLRFIEANYRIGRPVYIASASDRRLVEALAAHLGLFKGVFGSEAGVNLAGEVKANVLCAAFGEGGFDYIGNSPTDAAVWRRAHGVYIANADPNHLAAVRRWAPHAEPIGMRTSHWWEYFRAIRVHQWLKNILVFVPALAAHELLLNLYNCIVAFISVSLCASGIYIFNDLLDLRNDRAHPRKKNRPFAAGRITIIQGAALFPVLLTASLLLAAQLPVEFVIILAGYCALTCAYSLALKKYALVDVFVLSALYGIRLQAGAAATEISLSPWLIAFAGFIFLSLGMIKRLAEIISRASEEKGDPVGRGYRTADQPALLAMTVAAGYSSVLIFALYINSNAVLALYSHPGRLWVICALLFFWISRMILITHRGEMHDDPIVFTALDRVSYVILACCLVVLGASL